MSNELLKAVLDASILIQTIVKERYTDVALKLVSVLKAIYAPRLILYEMGNALVVLTFQNLITKEDAIRKLNLVSSIPTLNLTEIALSKAMDIAVELRITLYDAAYLALSLEEEVPLITADEELYEKGKKVTRVIHASEVKL